ncbi:MAG: UvrD-helicase domain-containing protein, partial [Chloroflexi bacterium]|nr:UvrD-helicase domain-containing protein [Chloroflexota bacterium]
MAFDPLQLQLAQQQQNQAALDPSTKILLVAGPGTGKSSTIQQRVDFLLSAGVVPAEIYIISFTNASTDDLKQRIVKYCSAKGRAQQVNGVAVCTMHSL